ncbi:MAG TPA: DUF2017 domain-containing protein [Nocardioidaceae bacterium]|nr:DUF2017 domain-containing protein [Nocardioidaceae bacterium]
MRQQWTAAGKGRVVGGFAALEADLLRTLVAQVVELIRDDAPAPSSDDPLASLLQMDGPVDPPDDPVLARLLPDAYRDDVESAGEFRRFTERGLRDQKADNGLVVLESLRDAGLPDEIAPEDDLTVEVELMPEEVQAWLRTLTDVRIALATRLGVEDDDEDYWASLPEDEPRSYLHDIYDWLGFVQEALVHTLA